VQLELDSLPGRPPPGQYDIATMTALHSESFGSALAKLGRYKKLVCPELLSIEIKKSEARLEFRWLLAQSRVPMFLAGSAHAGQGEVAGFRQGAASAEAGISGAANGARSRASFAPGW
jgi:hypothetical protein